MNNEIVQKILDICEKHMGKEANESLPLENRLAYRLVEIGLRKDAPTIMQDIAPLLPEPMRSMVITMYGLQQN